MAFMGVFLSVVVISIILIIIAIILCAIAISVYIFVMILLNGILMQIRKDNKLSERILELRENNL